MQGPAHTTSSVTFITTTVRWILILTLDQFINCHETFLSRNRSWEALGGWQMDGYKGTEKGLRKKKYIKKFISLNNDEIEKIKETFKKKLI